MNRQTALAMALCFLIFLGWQYLYLEPLQRQKAAQQTQNATSQVLESVPHQTSVRGSDRSEEKKQNAQPANQDRVSSVAAESRNVTTDLGTAVVGNSTRVFENWDLNQFRGSTHLGPAVDMDQVSRTEGQLELAFDHSDFAYLNGVRGKLENLSNGVRWVYEDDLVKLTRDVTKEAGRPDLNVSITAQFKRGRPNYLFVSAGAKKPDEDGRGADHRKVLYWSNDSVERVDVSGLEGLRQSPGAVKWIGAESHYFLFALLNQGADQPKALIQPVGADGARISMVYPVVSDSITIPLKVYFGPKQIDLLRKVEPTLDHSLDLGWFTVFAYPLLRLLKWFYAVFQNYGVAIIMLTLLVKVVTFPLTYKSMKSMKQMAKIQPQLQKIREKHKDDREALNREMLTMMRSHGYNPMAGCLPILVQMPVFFALYQVLFNAVELYHAPFAFWIHDLSMRDPFFVTPVLLTATMFLQQKLTPSTATDPMQQKMLQFMPVIFGAFMLTLPAGLTIYMLVNALASIVQQLFFNKKFQAGNVSAVVARAR